MAHTAIRLGYLSSSGGGGAGYEEYISITAFPSTGEDAVIYLASDTNKIYRWNGMTYIQMSPSEVTSVNTKVGAVVLAKADIGLGQVDNTSDLNKPISTATQDALDNLYERIIPIEERDEVLTVYAYENNAQVYADGQPGVKDPSALIRDGWYFKNDTSGEKINWYYFDGTSQGTATLGDFKSAYAIMTFDAVSGAASPIIAIYTFPTGTGDVIPGFAHSRIVYDGPMTPIPVVGKQYLVYAGQNPSVHPELPRINLALIPGQSIGDRLPTEQILTVSFGSNSIASVNSVQYMVESLGLFSDPVKHEMDLRIRQASQLDLTNHVTATNNPHSVTKTQLGLENVDNTSDLNKPISTATQTALDLITDVNWTGDYNNGVTYTVGDGVMFNGASFRMISFIGAAGYPPASYPGSWLQVTDYVSANDIGLGNVDNTSDLDKPISTATQDALDDKQDTLGFTPEDVANKSTNTSLGTSDVLYPTQKAVKNYVDTGLSSKISSTEKGVANGVAPLNSLTKIDATYLPSYVDDIEEYANLASFPAIGETGKLYIALDTNLVYRWTGSVYVEISPSAAITWGSITGTLTAQTDLQSALDAKFDDPTGTTAEYIRGDGTLATFPTTANQANSLVATVFNKSGSPITKFSVVYINGGQGDLPTIALAQGNNESNSSKTFGVVYADIPNMQSGQVIVTGALTGLNTDQFNPTAPTGNVNGVALYLSPTVPGGLTTTKPSAPNHVVYIATIVRTHQTQGIVEVRIQNGFELGELHNVQALNGTVLNNQVLKYDLSTSLWKNQYIGLASDIEHSSFSVVNNQTALSSITGLAFSNTSVRSFDVEASVTIDASFDLFEVVNISGIQKGSEWDISISSVGDNTGVIFSITSSGQLQYTSQNYTGFVSGTIKFRAITTSV